MWSNKWVNMIFVFPGNYFCSARNEKMIRYEIWFVNSKSLRIGLNFIKVKCYFRMFCICCIFVVLTILPGSYTAPSPSPQVSAIPEKRKKWCMKILKGTFYISWKILRIMAVIFFMDWIYRWIPWSSYHLSEGKDEERNE